LPKGIKVNSIEEYINEYESYDIKPDSVISYGFPMESIKGNFFNNNLNTVESTKYSSLPTRSLNDSIYFDDVKKYVNSMYTTDKVITRGMSGASAFLLHPLENKQYKIIFGGIAKGSVSKVNTGFLIKP